MELENALVNATAANNRTDTASTGRTKKGTTGRKGKVTKEGRCTGSSMRESQNGTTTRDS